MIDSKFKGIDTKAQCNILKLARSTFYYRAVSASEEDLAAMRALDELYQEDPTRGTRRMSNELQKQGFSFGRDKTRRLMQRMRMKTIYCRPRTTVCDPARYSMDGKGRAIDNVIVERFFRTIKYDKLYLESLETGADVQRACHEFIHYYNHKRDHSSIGNQPPIVFYSLAA